eukprot:CAMPEP_0204832042 /NCGR_PEP_ID=MMETSP1346-20131115/12508_1 /ASSEMBLY_ACC=CAM_ASM_000771 /TAXON_ID=215587 /ORGANISM="Aplanochytrium stocchinoi, Strain GSBS06" /LENGTH=171 /DNA_ID=CAMNT_0051963583 /DNA_START=29 /DNA_END=540 /DNA_ORIENTATION=+
MAAVVYSASRVRLLTQSCPFRACNLRTFNRNPLSQRYLYQACTNSGLKINRQRLPPNLGDQSKLLAINKSFFCSSSHSPAIVTKVDVQEALKDESTAVIDVREQNEILETGHLEYEGFTAKNIPLGILQDALTYSEDDFLDEFGFEKPKKDRVLIFSCKSGVRSDMACRIA